MPKLTKSLVDGLANETSRDLFVWDSDLKGFGVRIKSTGVKTYVVQYRNADGQTRRLVVGKHGALLPDQARKLAIKQLAAVAGGADPSAERRALRAGLTVAELCDWYLTEARAGRLLGRNRRPIKASSLKSDEARITQHIKPLLGARPVRTLKLADVERMQADVAGGKTAASKRRLGRGATVRGGAGTAGRSVATLRAICGHAVRWELIPKNPALGVRQTPVEKRTRRLSSEEIEGLGRAMREAEAFGELPAGLAAVQLMLLTGFRRMEALGLRHAWVAANSVHFPDTKTGKQQRVIGSAALRLIAAQRGDADQVFVFPSDRTDGHLICVERVLGRLCASVGIKAVTPHVLRHTFASVAADLGFTELTIAGLLGHAAQGVTQRYIHVDRALVAAADQVSGHIAGLLALELPDEVEGQAPSELAGRASAVADQPTMGVAPLRPLRTDADYHSALREYQAAFARRPVPGSPQAYRFETLGLLIATYEEARQVGDPLDALAGVMQAKGKTSDDLAHVIGGAAASEVLGRVRSLAIEDVRKLRTAWGVPAGILV